MRDENKFASGATPKQCLQVATIKTAIPQGFDTSRDSAHSKVVFNKICDKHFNILQLHKNQARDHLDELAAKTIQVQTDIEKRLNKHTAAADAIEKQLLSGKQLLGNA